MLLNLKRQREELQQMEKKGIKQEEPKLGMPKKDSISIAINPNVKIEENVFVNEQKDTSLRSKRKLKVETRTKYSTAKRPKANIPEDEVALDESMQCTLRNEYEKRPPVSMRYDGVAHEKHRDSCRQRCKNDGCSKKTYHKCVKCNVHLCDGKRTCFDNFHQLPLNINKT